MCIRGDGNCSDCFYNYDVRCDVCGELSHFCETSGSTYPDFIICDSCEEDTAWCQGCGERFHKSEMYVYDSDTGEDFWCEDCHKQENVQAEEGYILSGIPGDNRYC